MDSTNESGKSLLLPTGDDVDADYSLSRMVVDRIDGETVPRRSSFYSFAQGSPRRDVFEPVPVTRKSFFGIPYAMTIAFEASLLYPVLAIVTLAFKFWKWPFSLHPLFMAVGYFLLMNAVSFLQYREHKRVLLQGPTNALPEFAAGPGPTWPQRKARHKAFALGGFTCVVIVGFISIVCNKFINGKSHFTSLHSLVGLASALGVIIQGPVLGSLLHFKLAPRAARYLLSAHRLIGHLTVASLAGAFFLGLRTKWFLNCWMEDIENAYANMARSGSNYDALDQSPYEFINSIHHPRWVDLIYNSIYFFFILNLCIYGYNFVIGRAALP